MRFTLRSLGPTYTYDAITRGRKTVGRVFRHADGHWVGMIGKTDQATGKTRDEAFYNVTAKALGFDSPEALRNHNAGVRARNRAAKATARGVLDDMMRGDFASLDRLLRGNQ